MRVRQFQNSPRRKHPSSWRLCVLRRMIVACWPSFQCRTLARAAAVSPKLSDPASGFFFILAANSTILRIASARDGTSICPRRQSSTVRKKGSSHGGILKPPTSSGVAMVDAASLRPSSRQNVIGEMFWFAGKLGRDRVCALVKGHIEMPSDFAGVGYTDMDDRGAWEGRTAKKLTAAGYTVNFGQSPGVSDDPSPPPWSVEESCECLVVKDRKPQLLAYVSRRSPAGGPRRGAAVRCQHLPRQAAGFLRRPATKDMP